MVERDVLDINPDSLGRPTDPYQYECWCESCGAKFFSEVIEHSFEENGNMCPECIDHFAEVPKSDPVQAEPEIIQKIRACLKSCGGIRFKDKDGKKRRVLMDSFTASAIIAVYDALNVEAKAKYAGLNHPVKMANVAWKLVKTKGAA